MAQAKALAGDNLRGVLLMVTAMAAFTGNDTLLKAVTHEIPLFQALFLRGLATLAVLGGLARVFGPISLRLARPDRKIMGLRVVSELAATLLFLTALQHMPLANLSAIMQGLPLFVTLMAALVFGETVGWRRWSAIGLGFVGVLCIIKPGTEGFDRFALVGLAAMLAVAARDLVTRRLPQQVSALSVTAYAVLAVTALGALGLPFQGWAPVRPIVGLQILGAALFITLGFLAITQAMRSGDLALVTPFRYTALLFAIGLGYAIFGQLPDRLTLFGAGLVIASGLFSLWREARLRRPAPVVAVPVLNPAPTAVDPARLAAATPAGQGPQNRPRKGA